MYKKILKNIRESKKLQKSDLATDLFKNIGKRSCAVRGKTSHFIFSAENPLYLNKRTINMNHDQVVDFLKKKGYQVESINGKYGTKEKSILVHNPTAISTKHLMKLATKLGQESGIYSDGLNHEIHYFNGDNAGSHHKGYGTNFHDTEPDNYYSTLDDGTHFTHNLKFDKLYNRNESLLKLKPEKLNKSEEKRSFVYVTKSENKIHPLDVQDPDINLIHYSPVEGIKEIDPEYEGVRGISAEAKQGKTEHPTSNYYLEGVTPEDIVTTGVKHKYIAKLGDMKLYDLGKDSEKLFAKAKEIANKRQINPGSLRMSDVYQLMKDSGYSGFYNSAAGNEIRENIVRIFNKITPHESHPIHPNDKKLTSSINHHENDQKLQDAKEFAEKEGHHNHKFLFNLLDSLKK